MKAILIGNGFSSQLIPEYRNDVLKKRLHTRLPQLVDKLDDLWSNIHSVISIKHSKNSTFLYRDAETSCLSDEEDGWINVGSKIVLDDLKQNKDAFKKLLYNSFSVNLNTSDKAFDKYISNFYSCLRHQITNDKIIGVEPFYALAKLAKELKIISRTELQQIESEIKELLRNDGKYAFEFVDIALCTKLASPPKNTKEQFSSNVKMFLEQFRSIYTTNYDCLLEDFTDKEIGHLHGTFDISKNILRQKSNNQFDWNVNEDIILGFDADEKEENIKHLGVNNLNKHYLNKLASSNIDEIHFLGYSGINDQHINENILNNSKLKKIVYYGNPNSINDPNYEYEEYIKYCLGIKTLNANVKLIIKSWDEVWNKLYVL